MHVAIASYMCIQLFEHITMIYNLLATHVDT